MQLTNLAINLAENGKFPDYLIRYGIRHLSKQRLAEIKASDCEKSTELQTKFIEAMNAAPAALVPELANAQHYEVPSEFFSLCLGTHKKYSSCFWLPETKKSG